MLPCGNDIISGASIACTENNIATPKDPDTAAELHWNTADLPLSLIIPTFDLPTLSVPAVTTASYAGGQGAPTATVTAPSATMEESAGKAGFEISRLWRLCLTLLLINHVFLWGQ
ncbi:uncharacterized protein N7482_001588 [Penicillium canariense]|uniref:Uncharacterized protein n=1 Tax=Penicillium canariense TaxID=189055 RepID=A0A9W9IHG0_9EURO|nr:uncharacterized protein N7482_001588 [Penicillium canariense]KAJ5175711.1 hypothetical protein N7482_001588 [Penicillium canariense]